MGNIYLNSVITSVQGDKHLKCSHNIENLILKQRLKKKRNRELNAKQINFESKCQKETKKSRKEIKIEGKRRIKRNS